MYAENLISTPEAQADFYPTPKELGKKMLQGIDLGFISTVLEPSAGKGDLIRCLAEESIAQEHRYNPQTIHLLQQATWRDDYNLFQQYSHAFFFCQQHKVVAAHACEIFVWFQLLPCQPYKFPQHHITLPCSYGTVDVIEILNVQENASVFIQLSLFQKLTANFVNSTHIQSAGQ